MNKLRDVGLIIAVITGLMGLLGAPSCAGYLGWSARLDIVEAKLDKLICFVKPEELGCPK